MRGLDSRNYVRVIYKWFFGDFPDAFLGFCASFKEMVVSLKLLVSGEMLEFFYLP